jgi:hypothetical protein
MFLFKKAFCIFNLRAYSMRGRLQNPLFEQEISITILETG